MEIPAFDPAPLRALLDTPEIRAALPPVLLSRAEPANWVETFKSNVLRLSGLWLVLGLALLTLAVIPTARSSRRLYSPGAPRSPASPRV